MFGFLDGRSVYAVSEMFWCVYSWQVVKMENKTIWSSKQAIQSLRPMVGERKPQLVLKAVRTDGFV